MKRVVFTAAILLSGVVAVPAQTITTNCDFTRRSAACQTQFIPPMSNSARVIHIPAADPEWREDCKPVIERDRYGVGHYRFPRPDCVWQR